VSDARISRTAADGASQKAERRFSGLMMIASEAGRRCVDQIQRRSNCLGLTMTAC
jgi:hypothetical protein